MSKLVSAVAAIGLFIVSASFACAQTKEATICIGTVESAPDGKEGIGLDRRAAANTLRPQNQMVAEAGFIQGRTLRKLV
jgi:hypothetical protein